MSELIPETIGMVYDGVRIVDDEDGGFHANGHVPPDRFIEVLSQYATYLGLDGRDDLGYVEKDVEHIWAVPKSAQALQQAGWDWGYDVLDPASSIIPEGAMPVTRVKP